MGRGRRRFVAVKGDAGVRVANAASPPPSSTPFQLEHLAVSRLRRCKTRLLHCFGVKDVGAALGARARNPPTTLGGRGDRSVLVTRVLAGCAESAHVLCATCLSRWWDAQNQLREDRGQGPVARKVCPCCKVELRSTGEMRNDTKRYYMGLLKVEGTW